MNSNVLAFETHGDGPGVVLIHGFPFNRTMWRSVLPFLTGRRVICPDLSGMGCSPMFAGAPTLSSYAEAISGLLDELNLDEVVLGGLSMGGYVAFELMRTRASRFTGLILMNTRAGPDDGNARAARDLAIETVRASGQSALADAMLIKLFAAGTLRGHPAVVAEVRRMIESTSVEGLTAALAAIRGRPDSTNLLPLINIPTLVIAGEEDQITPAAGMRSMAGSIRKSTFVSIAGAGHLTPLERPGQVGRSVRAWLEGLGA